MSWASVVVVILQLLGPLVVKWLEKLLLESADLQRAGPSKDFDTFRDELTDLFTDARRGLWWWEFRKRAALALVEAAALKRSAYLRCVAARTPFVDLPRLSDDERRELRNALRG